MKAEVLTIDNHGNIIIPKEYILNLEIRNKVLCILEDDEIIIRPFYEELKDDSKSLLEKIKDEGFSGEELLNEYKRRKKL